MSQVEKAGNGVEFEWPAGALHRDGGHSQQVVERDYRDEGGVLEQR